MSSRTSLTPAMGRLLRTTENTATEIASLRALANDALAKGMKGTAVLLAEELLTHAEAGLQDRIFFADCLYSNCEYHRCLAALELSNLISSEAVMNLGNELLSVSSSAAQPLPPTPPVSSSSSSSLPGEEGSNKIIIAHTVRCVHLASLCLVALEQYEDCLTLVDPLVCVEEDDEKMEQSVLGARLFAHKVLQEQYEFNRIAGFYNAVGLCYDNLDNRIRCIRAFTTAVRIDPCCLEALQYVCSNGLITKKEKKTLFSSISFVEGHEALRRHYRLCLLDDESCSGNGAGSSSSSSSGSSEESGLTSAAALTRKAEYYFGTLQQPGEAYRLIRQAYALDPFDKRCLGVYIGTLIELGLKTELFYLAHELTNTYPKLALSWYAVGCYYWCCQKLELAQKYLQKCNKMNKRSATALVALGHVLSAQEESEHAISAFRAASRLIPADHRPIVLMAKELVRTNYLSLALHLLSSALEMAPNDALVLNELGVIYLKLDRLEDAVEHLSKAVAAVLQASRDSLALAGHGSSAKDGSRNVLAKPAYCKIQGGEIFSNYATALRRSGEYAEALGWYQLSLTESANDANTHACVAFTLHLMRRFDEAVSAYHRALSAAPNSTFCAEMLTRALEDSFNYPSAAEDGDGDDVDDENFHTENTFAGGSPGPLQLGEQNIEHLDITHGSGVLWDIRTTT